MTGRGGFDTLVESTAGLQPLRRMAHALYGVLIVVAVTITAPTRSTALLCLGAIFLAQVGLDAVRLTRPDANEAFFRFFRFLVSPREAKGPASSTWYTLGALAALALFPRPEALSGILVLALADPAASLGGRMWGRTKFLGASLEGTIIFVGVAFAVLLASYAAPVAIAAAAVSALAERLSSPLDDNLTVPLVTAGSLALASGLL